MAGGPPAQAQPQPSGGQPAGQAQTQVQPTPAPAPAAQDVDVEKVLADISTQRGNPEDDGTTAGAIHRGWINLKEAVVGRDDEAIVNSVESGEDYLKEKFEAALNATDVAPETRSIIERAYQSVRQGHDQISSLKHGLEA